MRFSEASGRKVIATRSATTLGKLDGFLVDPANRKVIALRLKKTDGDADILLWSALSSFGRDAVTVVDDSALSVADGRVAELRGRDHGLLGKRILTDGGDEVGKVDDVEFDVDSGMVLRLLTTRDEIDGARLRGVGSYAVVIRSTT